MKVLVDTCIWSLAFRRDCPPEDPHVDNLRQLVTDGRATICGPVRQELLSGVKDKRQFRRLRDLLEPFPDVPIESDDYIVAAEHFNTCRRKGIQGSNTDFLLCAIASRHRLAIFTVDADFSRFAKHLPVTLHA